jgi:D-3-phosphoglycerate dehydrogenase
MKILIATYPFGETGRRPLEILQATGWELVPNPYRRRLKSGEVMKHLVDVDAVIAGTEPYTAETLTQAQRLKVIARVGIGLDNVDLRYCREHGIRVTYTPDAPSDGVAELTVANILNLLRHIHESDRSVREHAWNRLMGRLVHEVTIGVLGVGRIGSRVIRLLEPFKPKVLACDIDPDTHSQKLPGDITWCDANRLFAESDVVTVHIPMNRQNRQFINRERISRMKTGSMVINTSRGGVVDEGALVDALKQRHLGGAALDVFEKEPYEGPLTYMENVVLTAHIGASARESRYLMELGAAEDCIRALCGQVVEHDAIQDSQDG